MIAIVGPSQNDPTVTKAEYWCRKQFYALNVMGVCDADCRVMSIDPRYPGSVRDSFAWRYSWLRSNFEQGRLIDDGRLLLGDSGYALEPWLITPVPGFHATSTTCGRFNKAYSSIRKAEMMEDPVRGEGNRKTTGKKDDVERGFQRLGRIPGVIGGVDGTMIAIVGPSQNDPTVTKAAYWCRKQFYALNVMGVCDADCRVMSIDPRYPGSVHDSFAWRYSWLRSNFEQGRLIDDGRLLRGDSGYALEPWLITPVPGFHATSTTCGRFNKAHSSIRSVGERCIGLLKSRFQCLQRHRTLYYHPTTATVIISACAVLHNTCLSSREPEAEPDCDPDEPGLESGPSSEGSVVDDERLAPAHPRVSLWDRGRALRQRLVAQFGTRHSRASPEPQSS
ncbi:hypothetical protein ISCGN_026478 [Ixodes scapularis]